eukprot:scaffold408_cov388-Prasinococcus_capsulatus_cf.AAC.16
MHSPCPFCRRYFANEISLGWQMASSASKPHGLHNMRGHGNQFFGCIRVCPRAIMTRKAICALSTSRAESFSSSLTTRIVRRREEVYRGVEGAVP